MQNQICRATFSVQAICHYIHGEKIMKKLLDLLNELLSDYSKEEQDELLVALFETVQQGGESGADD